MRTLIIATTLLALFAVPSFAADTATPAPTAAKEEFVPKEQWDKLSKEEQKKIMHDRREKRKAERAEWKKKFDAATPEEKEKMKAEMEAKREARKAEWQKRYDAASPEEKKKMDARRERFETRKDHRAEMHKNKAPATEAPATK